MGILDGVTTNPTLLARAGVKESKVKDHYKAICKLVPGDVSAEVISTDHKGMVREAEQLSQIDTKIVVKIPMTEEGVRALILLRNKGIRANCTLVFSPAQVLLAAKAGATYISPFIGRIDDVSGDGMELVQLAVHIVNTYEFESQILAASVRSPLHVVRAMLAGAHAVTAPYSVIKQLFQHPLTHMGLERFLADYQKAVQDK